MGKLKDLYCYYGKKVIILLDSGIFLKNTGAFLKIGGNKAGIQLEDGRLKYAYKGGNMSWRQKEEGSFGRGIESCLYRREKGWYCGLSACSTGGRHSTGDSVYGEMIISNEAMPFSYPFQYWLPCQGL